jgi:hypothetical protein
VRWMKKRRIRYEIADCAESQPAERRVSR